MSDSERPGRLDGRVAAITGGTRGLGLAIAHAMTDAGAAVALMGRSVESGERAVAELGGSARAFFVSGDASQRDPVEHFVDSTITRFGGIDVLVNNAGGAIAFEMIDAMSDETWDGTLSLNLSSAFWATRRALPSMMAAGRGRVINISGVLGKQGGRSGVAGYITSKHAINGFTKAVATEYGQLGITCNSLCPGHMETEAMQNYGAATAAEQGVTYEETLKPFADEASLRALTKPEDVAAVAVFLASDGGAGITGALWSVDAGITSW